MYYIVLHEDIQIYTPSHRYLCQHQEWHILRHVYTKSKPMLIQPHAATKHTRTQVSFLVSPLWLNTSIHIWARQCSIQSPFTIGADPLSLWVSLGRGRYTIISSLYTHTPDSWLHTPGQPNSMPLEWWFSTRGNFPSGDIWQCLKTFWLSQLGGKGKRVLLASTR